MIVMIDDLRHFKDSITADVDMPIFVMRNSAEALDWLHHYNLMNIDKAIVIEQLWLDHDLGMVPNNGKVPGEEKFIEDTTIPFVKELVKLADSGNKVAINNILVHSSNPVGVRNIIRELQPIYKNIISVDAGEYFVA